jgi:hypothetical protein
MPVYLTPGRDRVFELEIGGLLAKADLDRVQAQLVEEIERDGPVRMLFVLDQFDGWAPHENWHDLTFYVKYGALIERIAIVGDEKWRDQALMFAAADLRRAPVEFFPEAPGAKDRALQWLTA